DAAEVAAPPRHRPTTAIDVDHALVQLVVRRNLANHVAARGVSMKVSVSDAKGQLTELVRRAEAGEVVILTRRGHEAVRLVPVGTVVRGKARRALLDGIRS